MWKAGRRRSVHHSSKSVEWYTPPDLFEQWAAEHGPFDLDPATDPRSPLWPLIGRHYTVRDDGLARMWGPFDRVELEPHRPWTPNELVRRVGVRPSRVWCNPPYGRALALWIAKAIGEFTSGNADVIVMLVPARTDTRWWNAALDAGAEPVFLRGRIRFVLPDGSRMAGAPFPSALLVFRRPSVAPKAWGAA